MKIIEGDLILTENMTFKESIIVRGNIKGNYNLKVIGNIDCLDIKCWDIKCWDINCKNIDCEDIHCKNIKCWDINCENIDCWNINCKNIDCKNIDCWDIIFCDKIQIKKGGKVKARALIQDRFNLPKKEWDLKGEKEK